MLKLLFLCILLGYAYGNVAEDDRMPYTGSRSINFDWELTKEVISKQKSNAIISPLSVKILLALLYEATGYTSGIHSNTEIELRRIFESPNNPDISKERLIFKAVLDSALVVHKNYEFDIGSRIYVDDFIQPNTNYMSRIQEHYRADVKTVSFADVKSTVSDINKWCAEATKNKIKQLVNEDSVRNAVMLMINAIYFKGFWSYPFPEDTQIKGSFAAYGKKNVQVDYMEQSGSFYYEDSKELNCELLRLPYIGGKFAMFFALPHENSNVNQLLERISTNTSMLKLAMWYMEEQDVNMTIPKFRFDFNSNLNQPLMDLRIKDIFTNEASLALLSRGNGTRGQLRVSNVLQKAGIVVSEKGTEAYAATEIQLVNKFGGDSTKIFKANRPFAFFIEDETNGALLFAGKVEDPLDFGKK